MVKSPNSPSAVPGMVRTDRAVIRRCEHRSPPHRRQRPAEEACYSLYQGRDYRRRRRPARKKDRQKTGSFTLPHRLDM
jgi:hypothetical protein